MPRLHPTHLQRGDHACTLFTTRDEQLGAATDYIRDGLARRDRCLYVCCEQAPRDFRAALWRAGIDVDAAEARGALVLLTKEEGHLKDGGFDPARLLGMLHAAVAAALADGFSGLSVAGDMTWLCDAAPGSDRLVEYEAALTDFFATEPATGLCQYNRRRVAAEALDHCLATHPLVRMPGPVFVRNLFYDLPQVAVSRLPNPGDVERKISQLEYVAAAE